MRHIDALKRVSGAPRSKYKLPKKAIKFLYHIPNQAKNRKLTLQILKN
jgi:hypothetical protein